MVILRLAVSNVTRRLGRSVMTILAMAVAGAVVTSGLSLSQGLPKNAYVQYRHYFQGDVVVYTPGFVGASPVTKTQGSIVRRTIGDSGFNPILQVYPELRSKGYLAQQGWEYRPFSAADIADLASAPGIVGVAPYKGMPATIASKPFAIRPLSADMTGYITSGRAPRANAETLEIVLNQYPDITETINQGVRLGEAIPLALPVYGFGGTGIPFVDATIAPNVVQATVVGFTAIPTRSVSWLGPGDVLMNEQGYLHASEVYLHPDTWESMWQAQSGGREYPVMSLGLKVEMMAQIKAITRELRDVFPMYSMFAVPDLAVRSETFGILDRFYQAPVRLWKTESAGEVPLAMEDFGSITAVMLFLNAGMLMASQMLSAVASRRTEIGILKSIGARGREVTLMIMLEALALAVIGAAGGFAVVRLAAIHLAISNQTPFLTIVGATLKELSVVLAITMGSAVVFGVLPAWKVSKYTVMEVFRNE